MDNEKDKRIQKLEDINKSINNELKKTIQRLDGIEDLLKKNK